MVVILVFVVTVAVAHIIRPCLLVTVQNYTIQHDSHDIVLQDLPILGSTSTFRNLESIVLIKRCILSFTSNIAAVAFSSIAGRAAIAGLGRAAITAAATSVTLVVTIPTATA
jgi:hypothetical protein